MGTPMGNWYLIEVVGFVLLPMLLFFASYRNRNLRLIKIAAIITIIGVIMNRLDVTVIGFRWNAETRYIPTWMEFVVTLAVMFTEIWIFRWVINRMPVLRDSPAWVIDGK